MRAMGVTVIALLLLTLAIMGAAATASAAPSPILDFDLTQGYGTTVVDSANGVVGTTHGTLWSTDPSGMPVLYFDNPIVYWGGDGDYFHIPNHAALNSPQVSLEVTIYPMDCGYYTVIVERAAVNLHMALDATGYESGTAPYFGLTVGGVYKCVLAPEGIPLNAWSHIVGTYDGNDMKLYVDGVLVATESGVGGPRDTGSNPLYLGHNPASNGYFNGYMSSFKMYDRALTAEEIAAEFNAPPVADADGPYAGSEGAPLTLDGSGSSDPDNNIASYSWDLDNDGSYDDATGVTTVVTFPDDGVYPVGLCVTDEGGLSDTDTAAVSVVNEAPIVSVVSAPLALVPVNTPVNVSASFTDPGVLDTHTAAWDWDGASSSGVVSETNGSGSVTGSHTYTAAGVYTIGLSVSDADGGIGIAPSYEYVVVYDPSAGFVTGGGWITSPAGAYAADPSLAGKATFGFVSKYKKGASIPTGNTEFQFRAAALNFHSTSYDWLVVTGSDYAKFKGTGTIDGMGEYKFQLWAGDNDPDTFRIKIWSEDGTVVYDNGMDQALGGGSIVVHR